jgi:hypothetical protein
MAVPLLGAPPGEGCKPAATTLLWPPASIQGYGSGHQQDLATISGIRQIEGSRARLRGHDQRQRPQGEATPCDDTVEGGLSV